jgi:hypothetical protein
MRHELTDARLRAICPPEKGRLEVSDPKQRNLVLRISAGEEAKGRYAWSVATRTQARAKTRIGLGQWPDVGIAEARKRARAELAAIDAGGDPMAERRALRVARAARAKEATVAQRFDEWRAAKEQDWSDRYRHEVARIAGTDIRPALGRRYLRESTRADWVEMIAKKRKTAPAMASLLYRVASAFLGYAEAAGWIETALLPRKGLATLAPTAAPRSRALSDAELAEVWRASHALHVKPRVFVRLLILTGAREMEVADIAAGEIDRTAAQWRIPADRAKNRQPLTLPLGPLALVEIAAVWPAEPVPAGWRLLRVRGFSKLKAKIDQLNDIIDPWRLHDLRRSVRTGMTRLGVPRDHAEAVLNHVSNRTALERTYDRHDYRDEIVAASLRWQSHVESLVTERPTAEVISLARSS